MVESRERWGRPSHRSISIPVRRRDDQEEEPLKPRLPRAPLGLANPNTGRSGSAGYVSGDRGTVGRVGDDVYAGKDGNIYKRNPGGGWEQHTPGGSWSGVQDRSRTTTLDGQQRARSTGQSRVQNYGRSRAGGAMRGGRRR